MLDNILYEDAFILDVALTSSGAAERVLYRDVYGQMMSIDVVHTGISENILYPQQSMQTFILKAGGELSFIF